MMINVALISSSTFYKETQSVYRRYENVRIRAHRTITWFSKRNRDATRPQPLVLDTSVWNMGLKHYSILGQLAC